MMDCKMDRYGVNVCLIPWPRPGALRKSCRVFLSLDTYLQVSIA